MKQKSKYLALLLRHQPEKANIPLDKNGWAPVREILKAVNVSFDELAYLVSTDDKQRYAFNEDKTMIRANQGHSIRVAVDMDEFTPKLGDVLYHGTVDRFIVPILLEGLKPMSRQYVHLSGDKLTAIKVGARRGEPVMLEIDAFGLMLAGIKIYKSLNGVYQVSHVPPELITVIKE